MERILLVDGNRGIYIPQHFARHWSGQTTGVAAEDWAQLLKGPEYEDYWEVWIGVCEGAIVTIDGGKYTLMHSDDLWAVPVEDEVKEQREIEDEKTWKRCQD